MTAPGEGELPQEQPRRKCNGCPRYTAGCRHCKADGRSAPYDHLCRVCHLSGLGPNIGHQWEEAPVSSFPLGE